MTTTAIAIMILAGVLSAVAFGWYAFWFEPVNFKISRLKINIKRGKANKGKTLFTILHLSDFHLRNDRIGKKLTDFLIKLHNLKPDFLFITGDLIEKDENFYLLDKVLSGFNASIEKFAVLGVHDYYNKSPGEFLKNMLKKKKEYKRQNDIQGLISILKNHDVKVLRNESRRINLKFSDDRLTLYIAGIEDTVIQKADVSMAFGQKSSTECKVNNEFDYLETSKPSKTKEHILNDSNRIVICLTHSPDRDLFYEMAKYGTDIILCGHTHGGQVRIPFIGAIISGCNIKAKYASGLFYFKRFVFYVSKGLGEGRYSPFRFYCRPEATFIEVREV